MDDLARYRDAWQSRRTRLFALVAMIVAFCVLLHVWPDPIVIGAGAVATLAAAWWFAIFRCPRCHEHFMGMPTDDVAFWRRESCCRCGLPVNTMPT